jgi:hypothetical protein
VGTFSCYSKPRNPMGLNFNALRSCQGFSYREIGIRDVVVHLHHESPNSELRCARAISPCHVASSLRSIGNRVIAISRLKSLDTGKSRMPNPDFPGSRAMCPRSDQWLQLCREIANRDFNKYETLTSANHDKTDPDGPCFLPAPKG